MLEATETYVPPIIRNILLFLYVFMQLYNAVLVFTGICIGLMQGLQAMYIPAAIGIDFWYPPEWLTYLCERYLNRQSAVEVDRRGRR